MEYLNRAQNKQKVVYFLKFPVREQFFARTVVTRSYDQS